MCMLSKVSLSGDTPQVYTLIIVLYFYFYFALLTYLFDIVWLLPYFKLLSVNTLLISLRGFGGPVPSACINGS